MPRQLSRRRDRTDVAPAAPSLPAEALQRAIETRGLDASMDLVAAATPAELARVLDLDLWRPARPGEDARFDVDRFEAWLETLVDHDPAVAARILADIETPVAAAALARLIRVFDRGVFEPVFASDDERVDLERRVAHGVTADVGGYTIAFRRPDVSDAVVAVLVELAEAGPDAFHAVMRGCRTLSNSAPEVDGLDDLLRAPAQAEYDIAGARRERQHDAGYVAPDDARAFLTSARHATRPAPRALPGRSGDLQGPFVHLAALMARLHETDPDAALARTHDLARLANTLVAGCSLQSRAFTPREASEAAVAICNLGLEHGGGSDLVEGFRIGWSLLYDKVSLPAATRLMAAIDGLRCRDADLLIGLHRVRRLLAGALAAGTPWMVHESLDPLAMLDLPTWTALLGLFSECPVAPAALTAIVHRRTGAISASAFDFIGTRAQIDDVARFLERLPALLEDGA